MKEVAFEEGPDRGTRTEEERFSGKINNVNQDIDVEKMDGGGGALGRSEQITNYSIK